MTAQVKTFADYEVLTASDVNNYLMNQALVKVLNTTERDALSTSVKTAYNTATGDVYQRDSTNAWLTYNTAWQTYTPTWTGSTTNPAIGNGTIVGRYMQQGKTVTFTTTVICGSTTTYGSGYYLISLPVTAVTLANQYQLVDVLVTDASASSRWAGTGFMSSAGTTVERLVVIDATNGIGPGSPMTYATSDSIIVSGTYQAA